MEGIYSLPPTPYKAPAQTGVFLYNHLPPSRPTIVSKNFDVLAKILLSENIYRKDATIFMARATPTGGQGLHG
jgi:hypothetical protein